MAELIRCAVNYKKWRVLVTAPSNVAVDNVLDRLMSLENDNGPGTGKRRSSKNSNTQKIKAVRLGHPARIQHGIQKYSLESLVQSSDGNEIVQDCRRELSNHLKTLADPKSRSPDKRTAYREMKSLRKEIKTREEKVVREVLRNANVVFATNVGSASSVFKHLVDSKGEPISFDLVIIDEAAQALEGSCWIRLVLLSMSLRQVFFVQYLFSLIHSPACFEANGLCLPGTTVSYPLQLRAQTARYSVSSGRLFSKD